MPAKSPRITNRRAFHEYHIHEKIECGIVLTGSEVKSLRNGKASIAEGFARIDPNTKELWLHNVDIAPYDNASPTLQHSPKRPRKLLAHRPQINKLIGQTSSKGMTLVPLALYFNNRGIAKIEIGVASGKAQRDKRQDLKKKEADRAMRRAMTRGRVG